LAARRYSDDICHPRPRAAATGFFAVGAGVSPDVADPPPAAPSVATVNIAVLPSAMAPPSTFRYVEESVSRTAAVAQTRMSGRHSQGGAIGVSTLSP
jgi:hypothetical protein